MANKDGLVIVPVEPVEGFYDEVEIEDMEYDEDNKIFYYPCPCGDRFQITLEEIEDGEEVGRCPSCTLIIKVIYDEVCNSPFSQIDKLIICFLGFF